MKQNAQNHRLYTVKDGIDLTDFSTTLLELAKNCGRYENANVFYKDGSKQVKVTWESTFAERESGQAKKKMDVYARGAGAEIEPSKESKKDLER